jgi:hypothetical protein
MHAAVDRDVLMSCPVELEQAGEDRFVVRGVRVIVPAIRGPDGAVERGMPYSAWGRREAGGEAAGVRR